MAARSSGSAVISFGLISVPVKLYIAASSEAFSFKRISPEGNITSQKVFDAVTNTEITIAECQKGYEYEKGNYLILQDEELKALEGAKSNTIELIEFVKDTNFNPLAVEKGYYLAPDKGAERPYRLLSSVLKKESQMAVGKYYARGRDHLVVMRPQDDALVMFQMYYANELRPFEYKFSSATEPTERELGLAKMLVANLASDAFDPSSFVDEYAARIREVVERKRAGEVFEVPKQLNAAPVMDLAALLEASLAAPPQPKAAPLPQPAPLEASAEPTEKKPSKKKKA